MRKFSYETWAGIFVLVGLFCVGYLTIQIGDFNPFHDDSYVLRSRFNSISGLRLGNHVEMLGMEIGKVAGFEMDQQNQMAIVELRIKKGVRVHADAIASIKTAGLIGDRHVSIDAGGAAEVLKPGETIRETQSPMDLSDLIGKYVFGGVKND